MGNELYNKIFPPEINSEDDTTKEQLIKSMQNRPDPMPLCYPCLECCTEFLTYCGVKMLVGNPCSGKSLFALSIGLSCFSKNIKWRYLPLECDRNHHLLRLACLVNNDWDALSSDIKVSTKAVKRTNDQFEGASKAICNNPSLPVNNNYSQNVTSEYILNWVEDQFKSGVRVVIIDPIAQIDFFAEARVKYQAEESFMQKAVALSHKYKTSLVLVAHTVKQFDNVIPTMKDIQGSAAFTRLADSILILHNHSEESKSRFGSNIFQQNGFTRQVEFNRIVNIAKSRNSTGTDLKIAFNLENASFNELGFFAPKSQLRPELIPDKYSQY